VVLSEEDCIHLLLLLQRFLDSGLRVQGLGSRVEGLGLRVEGLKSWGKGFGFKV